MNTKVRLKLIRLKRGLKVIVQTLMLGPVISDYLREVCFSKRISDVAALKEAIKPNIWVKMSSSNRCFVISGHAKLAGYSVETESVAECHLGVSSRYISLSMVTEEFVFIMYLPSSC